MSRKWLDDEPMTRRSRLPESLLQDIARVGSIRASCPGGFPQTYRPPATARYDRRTRAEKNRDTREQNLAKAQGLINQGWTIQEASSEWCGWVTHYHKFVAPDGNWDYCPNYIARALTHELSR